MLLSEIHREKSMAEIIVERDSMIETALVNANALKEENEKLKARINELEHQLQEAKK